MLFGKRGEAIERPCPHELLRMRESATKDLDYALTFSRRPVEERQRPHDLQPQFPLVTVRQRANEQPLVRLHKMRGFMRDLLEQVQGTHRDEPVGVKSKLREL
jgi:hypothetical protein